MITTQNPVDGAPDAPGRLYRVEGNSGGMRGSSDAPPPAPQTFRIFADNQSTIATMPPRGRGSTQVTQASTTMSSVRRPWVRGSSDAPPGDPSSQLSQASQSSTTVASVGRTWVRGSSDAPPGDSSSQPSQASQSSTTVAAGGRPWEREARQMPHQAMHNYNHFNEMNGLRKIHQA